MSRASKGPRGLEQHSDKSRTSKALGGNLARYSYLKITRVKSRWYTMGRFLLLCRRVTVVQQYLLVFLFPFTAKKEGENLNRRAIRHKQNSMVV